MSLVITENKEIILAVREAVNKIGGIKLPKPDSVVLIKPNVNTGSPPPASTSPEVVGELVKMSYEAGAKEVIVADRSWVQFFIPRIRNTVENMKCNGIFEAAKKEGAEVIGFEEGKWIRIRDERATYWKKSFRISKMVEEFDYIINVPVLKTHFITDFTLSLKNSVGILHTFDRLRLHASNIQEKTAEINLAYAVDLVVIDGSRVFVSGGPNEGEVKIANLVISSNNRVEADIAGYNLLRELGANLPSDAQSHPMIARAIELGIDGFGTN